MKSFTSRYVVAVTLGFIGLASIYWLVNLISEDLISFHQLINAELALSVVYIIVVLMPVIIGASVEWSRTIKTGLVFMTAFAFISLALYSLEIRDIGWHVIAGVIGFLILRKEFFISVKASMKADRRAHEQMRRENDTNNHVVTGKIYFG